VYSAQGVPVSVSSIAQIKISRFPEALRNAASQFLGMSRADVEQVAQQVSNFPPLLCYPFCFPPLIRTDFFRGMMTNYGG
jgi:hypothetical protein